MGKYIHIRRCDSSKSFLAGSIPNLKLHFFTIDVDGSYLEINANCRYITTYAISIYTKEVAINSKYTDKINAISRAANFNNYQSIIKIFDKLNKL